MLPTHIQQQRLVNPVETLVCSTRVLHNSSLLQSRLGSSGDALEGIENAIVAIARYPRRRLLEIAKGRPHACFSNMAVMADSVNVWGEDVLAPATQGCGATATWTDNELLNPRT